MLYFIVNVWNKCFYWLIDIDATAAESRMKTYSCVSSNSAIVSSIALVLLASRATSSAIVANLCLYSCSLEQKSTTSAEDAILT